MARARVVRRGGPRRKTQWTGMLDAAGAATIPGFVVVTTGAPAIIAQGFLIAGSAGVLDEETTITRLIGSTRVRLQLDTANLSSRFAIGVYIARLEAVTAGVAALPSPLTDPDAEWLYYVSGQIRRENTANVDRGIGTFFMPFDVRGQRIVRVGQTPVWIAEISVGLDGIDVAVAGRYLVKLT